MRGNCHLINDGRCTKYDGTRGRKPKCKPSDITWCDERMDVINIDEMCERASIFGNYFYYITEQDIEALRQGKVLCDVDEYGMFIALRKESEVIEK